MVYAAMRLGKVATAVLIHVRFWGQSGRRPEVTKCLLLTQSGHSRAANASRHFVTSVAALGGYILLFELPAGSAEFPSTAMRQRSCRRQVNIPQIAFFDLPSRLGTAQSRFAQGG
jgi:hypothetical protein